MIPFCDKHKGALEHSIMSCDTPKNFPKVLGEKEREKKKKKRKQQLVHILNLSFTEMSTFTWRKILQYWI